MRNVGQTPPPPSPLIGLSRPSISCARALIGCPGGEGHRRGGQKIEGFIWFHTRTRLKGPARLDSGTCVCLIQLSVSLLVMGDFWSPIDAKLWPDYWILVFRPCMWNTVTVSP